MGILPNLHGFHSQLLRQNKKNHKNTLIVAHLNKNLGYHGNISNIQIKTYPPTESVDLKKG